MQVSHFLFTVGTVSKCLASVLVNQSIHIVIISLQDRRRLDYSQFLPTNSADIAKNVQSYKYASHVQCCRYKQSNKFSCNCFGMLLLLLLSLLLVFWAVAHFKTRTCFTLCTQRRKQPTLPPPSSTSTSTTTTTSSICSAGVPSTHPSTRVHHVSVCLSLAS